MPLRYAMFLPLLSALIALFGGCAQRAGALFPTLENAPVWPAPPDQARVRYVGELSTAADLKAPKNFGEALGEALFGKKPLPAMLTPYAICNDGADRLFVADSSGQVVHVLDLARRRWNRLAPPTPPGRFGAAVGLAWDPTTPGGRLFVSDSADQCVYVFAGGQTPVGAIGREYLNRPCGIAFDEQNQRLLIADSAAHQVIALTPDGRLISRAGARGTGLGEFNYPTNLAIDSVGRVYVSDSLNFRVQQLDPDLRPIRAIGRKGDMPGYFAQPKGVAVDPDDHLYVVDANFEAVQIFDSDGVLLLSFGEEGRDPGEFWLPAGIFVDRAAHRIWVADSYNRRVQVFDYVPEAVANAAPAIAAPASMPAPPAPATGSPAPVVQTPVVEAPR